ncbi:TPA: hypothetical protein PXJ37_002372 [Yersinia enterocolitica]|nr:MULTISPECIES: hypothetical protein [Yersinia]EKN3834095.1 hypothetical protein [Yersinia enterocolitica]ELI8444725.1 hypothetical protein [Yersinia enterocolitica]HDL6612793.1 hypothetical protein [Yersinia enterocolitica]HDL6726474.1 hypothetical protein [Yersinia enterocolitica]HDL8146212.1 hypothetical protein [Yersinia enterocolitica]
MMKIAVHTPFKLSLAGQPDIAFLVGTHTVTKDVAEHWFTLAHAEVIDGEVEQNNTDLQASILEMQKQIDEQAQALADRDTSILEMQKQIDELTKPKVKANGKEQKPTDTSTVQD